MKLDKMAQQDAEKWASAEMFYGEGAGTRRKLTWAEISEKGQTVDGYMDAFDRAYEALNMNKFAKAAIKERKSLDRVAKAGQNLRALKSGNLSSLSTGVFLAVGLGYAAHVTGYDKKAYSIAKEKYLEIERRVHVCRKQREISRLRDAKMDSV